MKICFLNDIDILGGGEIWVLRACQSLRALGHDVSVACPRGSALAAQCETSGLDHVAYARHAAAKLPDEQLSTFLDERGSDLLYITVIGNFCEARFLGKMADTINASRQKNKMAVVLKTGLPPIGNLTPEHYGCGAGPAIRRLHVVAPALQRAFTDWQPIFNDAFVEVFREGIELERFSRNMQAGLRERQRLQIPHDYTVVTCIARLADGMKGQSVLLRAIPGLLERYPRTVFVIAGDGPDRTILEELAADLNVAAAVRFTGHVDDVPALLNASDILCHPSLHDGMPNAVVEAMSMGLPVVASRVAAIPELVVDGVSGLLVRPNDVKQLTSALDCILCNEHGQRENFGVEGSKQVHESYDLRKNQIG